MPNNTRGSFCNKSMALAGHGVRPGHTAGSGAVLYNVVPVDGLELRAPGATSECHLHPYRTTVLE